jgi:hypothetical protein
MLLRKGGTVRLQEDAARNQVSDEERSLHKKLYENRWRVTVVKATNLPTYSGSTQKTHRGAEGPSGDISPFCNVSVGGDDHSRRTKTREPAVFILEPVPC